MKIQQIVTFPPRKTFRRGLLTAVLLSVILGNGVLLFSDFGSEFRIAMVWDHNNSNSPHNHNHNNHNTNALRSIDSMVDPSSSAFQLKQAQNRIREKHESIMRQEQEIEEEEGKDEYDGPLPKVWPKATIERYTPGSSSSNNDNNRWTFSAQQFTFDYLGINDEKVKDILQKAQHRFVTTMNTSPEHANITDLYPPPSNQQQQLPLLQGITIQILQEDTPLNHGVDESYELYIPSPSSSGGSSESSSQQKLLAQLNATTVYGVLHGLQTLKQVMEFGWIVPPDGTNTTTLHQSFYTIPDTPIFIQDEPLFLYRGLMIDTSRHYLPLQLILNQLDAMEMNKLNILHWHLTDRNSWPYVSKKYPELAQHGKHCVDCVYTAEDIQRVMQQAAYRGIRVVIEVDVPGHTEVIVKSHPEWMSECRGGLHEPLDVTQDAVNELVDQLYLELADIYNNAATANTEHWIHIGGDEVNTDCWGESAKITKWIKQHNMATTSDLLHYFGKKILNFVNTKIQKRPIVWEEMFDAGAGTLPESTVVDSWKSWDARRIIPMAIKAGHDVIYSECWYLDHLNANWMEFYDCDPYRIVQVPEYKLKQIIGGKASMWAERVDSNNFEARVWPRTSAMAERLWTGTDTIAYGTSNSRLNRFRCSMIQQLGIAVSPINPGHCENLPPIVAVHDRQERRNFGNPPKASWGGPGITDGAKERRKRRAPQPSPLKGASRIGDRPRPIGYNNKRGMPH